VHRSVEPAIGEDVSVSPVDLTRARSARAHAAVLTATRELLEEGGLPAATIDAIGSRSGVSKATIYNHWPSRTAIAAEAFGQQMAESVPLPDTGTAARDLAEQVRQVSAFYASDNGRVFAQLLAASVTDPHAAAYFREFFLAGRRETTRQLWRRAIDRGEARPGIDTDTAADLLFGGLIYRLLNGNTPLTEDRADAIASAALHGLLQNPSDPP
jgi:AcrR family transcriptional regulator